MEENDIIKSKIHLIRGEQVMLDSDLAELYGVETKNLKRQVRRHAIRFPEDFMFELTEDEYSSLWCQNGTSKERGGNRYLPFAFTASGIAMLSSVLTSEIAAMANIRIMRAFVAMRKQLSELSVQQAQIEMLELKADKLNDYVETIRLSDNTKLQPFCRLYDQANPRLCTERIAYFVCVDFRWERNKALI